MSAEKDHVALSEIGEEQAFYDVLYAESDIASPIPAHFLPQADWQAWNQYVGSLEGKRVVEFGAGDGKLAVWLAAQGAFVVAVELSPVGVDRIRQRAAYHGLTDRISALCGDCCRVDQMLAPNSVDVGLGWSILHHLPPREFGTSLAAVLKPGAHALFLENSNANPIYRLARRIRNNESAAGSPLTMQEIRSFVEAVGEGAVIYSRFVLFGHIKKYIFRRSRFFASLLRSVDKGIDAIPGARRWSSYIWVDVRRPPETL